LYSLRAKVRQRQLALRRGITRSAKPLRTVLERAASALIHQLAEFATDLLRFFGMVTRLMFVVIRLCISVRVTSGVAVELAFVANLFGTKNRVSR
jgi:hypothetical protein